MNLYLYDPEMRRPWDKMLPPACEPCRMPADPDRPDFVCDDWSELELPAVLVVHWTQVGQPPQWLDSWVRARDGRYVVLVGGGELPVSQEPRIFSWPERLGYDFDARLHAAFVRFWAEASKGRIDFGLLAPSQKPREVISALAILCQGYLAVQPPSDLGEGADKARAAMGWSEGFADSLRQTGGDWPTEQQVAETKKAKWWTDALGKKAAIEERLEAEWGPEGLPAGVIELLNCLTADEAPVAPGPVGKSYLEICSKLGTGSGAV